MIAEFGRVTNVAANNFFVKLDELTPKLLAFFEDNSATKAEVDAFNQKVGIIVVRILGDCIQGWKKSRFFSIIKKIRFFNLNGFFYLNRIFLFK